MATLVEAAMRRAGTGGLDLPVALLMGVAAGLAVAVAPVAILEQLVVASGLTDMAAAAQPPLGMKARVAFAAAAALIGFGIAYALMRGLDRASGWFEPAAAARDDAEEAPAPRVRRRDLHPDAPVRRPISASRDFGEPVDWSPAPPSDPRRRRAPLAETIGLAEAELPRMPWERGEAVEVGATDTADRDSAARPELVEERSDKAEAEEIEADPAPLDFARDKREEEPEAEAEPAAAVAPAPAPIEAPRASEAGQETIGDLLARFERALERRQVAAPARRAAEAARPAPEPADPIDDRLRSALENLKRFAPQRG